MDKGWKRTRCFAANHNHEDSWPVCRHLTLRSQSRLRSLSAVLCFEHSLKLAKDECRDCIIWHHAARSQSLSYVKLILNNGFFQPKCSTSVQQRRHGRRGALERSTGDDWFRQRDRNRTPLRAIHAAKSILKLFYRGAK